MSKVRYRIVIKDKEPDEQEKSLLLGEDGEEIELIDELEESEAEKEFRNHEFAYMSEPYKKRKTSNKLIPTEPTKTETSADGKKTPKTKP